MADFEARHVIEALRSGVSSRAVGQYFSHARPEILKQISQKLNDTCENKTPGGMIITGNYGQGKTHLLNTVFNMAHSENMVVSFVSLSKETPFNRMDLVYQKLLGATYLPKRLQPGFEYVLQNITPNTPMAADMLAFTAKQLQTDKLFYLFRSYLYTDDIDERYALLADLEGDFINSAALKRIYKRIFQEKAAYNIPFSKTKHMDDYFTMLSHLFLQMGYSGWVILFDETELIGKLGKKARLTAYKNMAPFLFGGEYTRMQATYSLFALAASYREDVVDGKNEFDNLTQAELIPAAHDAAEKVLKAIVSAKELQPLNREEMTEIIRTLIEFYTRAYNWEIGVDASEMIARSGAQGYHLLRTQIRAAVECLDQLYQYGAVGGLSVGGLSKGGYEEDLPELDGLGV